MAEDQELLIQSVNNLTNVIIYDNFSAPVAARIYTYPSIAAYEIMALENSGYAPLADQLHELSAIPAPEEGKELWLPLASLQAFTQVGKALVISKDTIKALQDELYDTFKSMDIPGDIFKYSIDYGNQVANHILMWADGDNFKETRAFPKYIIRTDLESWKPTPPDYLDGVEPHWNKIRPFVIDSSNQFIPTPPTKFEITPESSFFKEILEVYEVTNNLNSEQEEIARFWDSNPYENKITSAGHWVRITSIACKSGNADFIKSAEAFARVTIFLSDAFISCWDEKWRSIRIRPETVINQYVDEGWTPLLQTPPFPEYPSEHSVVSRAASVALTQLFGEPFQFTDDIEVEYGLRTRLFNSFYDASAEAAISRMYGGIHYMPAINNGLKQGKQVGDFIAGKLVTKK